MKNYCSLSIFLGKWCKLKKKMLKIVKIEKNCPNEVYYFFPNLHQYAKINYLSVITIFNIVKCLKNLP